MIDIEKARALVDVFRDQSQRIICQGTSPFALKVADLIDALMAERDALAREVDACAAALPGPYYMDPPDGGDVPISEQVKRMARDAARYQWLKTRKGLSLSSDGGQWKRADGTMFVSTHYLAEGNTAHAPVASLDEIIDVAMKGASDE